MTERLPQADDNPEDEVIYLLPEQDSVRAWDTIVDEADRRAAACAYGIGQVLFQKGKDLLKLTTDGQGNYGVVIYTGQGAFEQGAA